MVYMKNEIFLQSLSSTTAEEQKVQKRHRCDTTRQAARGSGRHSRVSAGVQTLHLLTPKYASNSNKYVIYQSEQDWVWFDIFQNL